MKKKCPIKQRKEPTGNRDNKGERECCHFHAWRRRDEQEVIREQSEYKKHFGYIWTDLKNSKCNRENERKSI